MTIFIEIYHYFWLHHPVYFLPLISSLFIAFLFVFYRYIYPKKHISSFVIVLLISIPPLLNIFRPGTFQSGDLSNHAEYLRAFFENLRFGIFVPRWAADFCAGNGCPTFMFTYILPYYFGSFFHFIGFSYIDSVKIVLSLSFIGSGMAMYYFMRDEIGDLAGLISAVFYLFSPYHLIDLHFRASIGEVLSFAFIPLIFLFSRRLIIYFNLKYFLLTIIISIFILFSHFATTVSIIPILISYNILLLKRYYKNKYFKQLIAVIFTYITAILLSAFYWLPAVAESKYTWFARNQPTSDFKTLQDYIYSTSGYGFLFEGLNGDYKLIIGYSHILVIFIALYLILFKKRFISKNLKSLLIIFLLFFFIYFLLMLRISKPLWDYFTFSNFFLVVWRLLVPIGFITSVIAGIILSKVKIVYIIPIVCVITIGLTMLNWGNRGMNSYISSDYYTHWDEYTEYTQIGNPFYDNLFKEKGNDEVQLASLKYRSKYPLESVIGNIQFKQIVRTTQLHEYVVVVNRKAIIKDNTFYFPGWEVIANNNIIPINYKYPTDIGKITFTLPKGLYLIEVKFVDTKIRKVADFISIISLIILILFIFYINNLFKGIKKTKLGTI